MASIVRRIVELAHDHGARALAQGYLFGKPQGIRKFARSRPQLASSSSKKNLSGPAGIYSNFMSMHFEMSEPSPDEMVMQPRTFGALLSLAHTA